MAGLGFPRPGGASPGVGRQPVLTGTDFDLAIGEMPVPEAMGDDGTTDVPDDVEERDDGVSDDGFAPSPSRNRMPVQIAA